MFKNLYALGRLKDGELNKTELAYRDYLEKRRLAGEVLWFAFEKIKLRLADRTFYTVDFAVMVASGELEMHEVKGSENIFMDDAKVKIKVAADQFPFRFIAAFPKKSGWEFKYYS